MYRGSWNERHTASAGPSDVSGLIVGYGYLSAAALARRERHENLLAEQAVQRDADLPHPSRPARIQNWLGNWVVRRRDAPDRTETAPPPRPGRRKVRSAQRMQPA
jgi:hypothetical protein